MKVPKPMFDRKMLLLTIFFGVIFVFALIPSFTQAADTTKPLISVSHAPPSPDTSDVITVTGFGTDEFGGSGMAEVKVRVDLNKNGFFLDPGEFKTCTSAGGGVLLCTHSVGPLAAGTYRYDATAKDVAGNFAFTSVKTFTVAVAPVGPTADFTGSPTTIVAGSSVTFTNTSTAGSTLIQNDSWTFGDGGTSLLQNPTHTYINPGTYTVTLTVTDFGGLTDTKTRTNYITVTGAPVGPTADFTGSPTTIVAGSSVTFTNNSTQGSTLIQNDSWTFGDGGTSLLQNPTHTYINPGTYTVTLTVTDFGGLTDTKTRTNYITVTGAAGGALTVTFAMDVGGSFCGSSGGSCTGAPPLAIDFNSTASGGVAPYTYSWVWGDGGAPPGNVADPSHTYAAGSYTVALAVTDSAGTVASAIAAVWWSIHCKLHNPHHSK